MKDFTTHKFTQRYGMESIGNYEHEYLTEEQIKESINKNNIYIQECVDKGIYGQEYTIEMKIEVDDLYDKKEKNRTNESYRFDILDLSKNGI